MIDVKETTREKPVNNNFIVNKVLSSVSNIEYLEYIDVTISGAPAIEQMDDQWFSRN